jgi:hypothetical protein
VLLQSGNRLRRSGGEHLRMPSGHNPLRGCVLQGRSGVRQPVDGDVWGRRLRLPRREGGLWERLLPGRRDVLQRSLRHLSDRRCVLGHDVRLPDRHDELRRSLRHVSDRRCLLGHDVRMPDRHDELRRSLRHLSDRRCVLGHDVRMPDRHDELRRSLRHLSAERNLLRNDLRVPR